MYLGFNFLTVKFENSSFLFLGFNEIGGFSGLLEKYPKAVPTNVSPISQTKSDLNQIFIFLTLKFENSSLMFQGFNEAGGFCSLLEKHPQAVTTNVPAIVVIITCYLPDKLYPLSILLF